MVTRDLQRFAIQGIGVVHSPFVEAAGTPIQPAAAGETRGTIEIFPAFVEGLRDLEGFDRVWILFWCHRACGARLSVVPYCDTVSHGVFATRAPARPNPIGMSAVKLVGVEGRFLHAAGLDMLDGTPVLDVKPYMPQFDSFPGQRCGWMDAADSQHPTRVADARFEFVAEQAARHGV